MKECEPFLTIEDDGICNQCHTYKTFKYKGEEEFLRILDAARTSDSKYDCAVMYSGGRDSTYALLKLAKDYDKKVLAINYDNPFTHPQARANIKNAVKALGVDLISFKLKNNIHERTFKSNLQSWNKHPDLAMLPMICVGCKQFIYHGLKIASENKVPILVSGGNVLEETTFKKELLGLDGDTEIQETYSKAWTGIAKGVLKNPSYLRPWYMPTMVRGYLYGDPHALGARMYARKIPSLCIFQYIPWIEKECLSRIQSEVGWDYPKELGTWRFDCSVGSLKEVLYASMIKQNEKEEFYSKEIREGLITRAEAMEKLEKNVVDPSTHRRYIEEVFDIAGISDRSMIENIFKDKG
ncbi:MAG TPA: hypothetical protein VGK23_11610 [Methanomassiliicoccales archaeon]